MTPSAGYTFNWTGMIGSTGGAGLRIKTFRMEHLASDRVEIDAAFDMRRSRRTAASSSTTSSRRCNHVPPQTQWAQLTRNGVPPLFVLRPLAGGFTPPNTGDEYPAPDPTDKFQMARARQMYEQRRIGTWPELEVALASRGSASIRRAHQGRRPAEARKGEKEWSKRLRKPH